MASVYGVTAMNIETILVRARALVAQGLLHDRECASAETAHKRLVRYTDPKAVRFSPAAAVYRAEYDLRKNSSRATKLLDVEVLKLLSKGGSMTRLYRNAKTLDEVLARFDAAIASAQEEKARSKKYSSSRQVEEVWD